MTGGKRVNKFRVARHMGDLYVGQSYHLKLLCKQAYHKNQDSWEDVIKGTSALWENSLLGWQISFLWPFFLFDNKNAHWTG